MEDENQLGHGAIRETYVDPRDVIWGRHVGMASVPFDWSKGYDVEQEVSDFLGTPFKCTCKDQNGSGSCGGQAWSYYGQVLNALLDKNTEEKSAKFIYSQTFVLPAGSGGRENSSIVITQGWGPESLTPSYENGQPPSEAFMQRKQDISEAAREHAKNDRALSYANVPLDIEAIAQAIRDNHGCIIGITGQNNGTWRTAFPLPPVSFANSWNHWMYVGKVKMINGKKYFGAINSWGPSVGEEGWQWISEDYFKLLILGYPVIWSIWTLVIRKEVTPPVIPPYVFTKTLRQGSRGYDVQMLQIKLKLKADGIFGPKTKAAVIAFQKLHGLVQDGIVGKNTNKYLNM